VFGYLGDARWASIYAVAAGATLLWTATRWGSGIPWDAGVDPATVPAGSVAGLSLVTWVVLASWLFLGWRTVTVESRTVPAGSGSLGVGSGAVGAGSGAVDSRAHLQPEVGYAPPPGDPTPDRVGEARPAGGEVPAGGEGPGDGGAPVGGGVSGNDGGVANGVVPANGTNVLDDTRPSRPSVGVPK
jgi:hypothetical protein